MLIIGGILLYNVGHERREPGVFFLCVFCTAVKALELQVRSMHGAVPLCAAHEARECETCSHTTQHNTTPQHCLSCVY